MVTHSIFIYIHMYIKRDISLGNVQDKTYSICDSSSSIHIHVCICDRLRFGHSRNLVSTRSNGWVDTIGYASDTFIRSAHCGNDSSITAQVTCSLRNCVTFHLLGGRRERLVRPSRGRPTQGTTR